MKAPQRKLPRRVEYHAWVAQTIRAHDRGTQQGYAQGWADAKADTLEQEMRDNEAMMVDLEQRALSRKGEEQ